MDTIKSKTHPTAQPMQVSVNMTNIHTVDDLKKAFPQQFDRIGKIKGKYHITLDPSHHPVVHAQRKMPIEIEDQVKKKLHKLVEQDIITPIEQPTPWVNSMT